MNSNVNLYYFIFYTTCSVNKQQKYTYDGYKKEILLYNTKRYNTSTHIHYYNSMPDRVETTITTTTTTQLEWIFLYPVKT